MRTLLFVALLLSVSAAGCSKKKDPAPAPTPAASSAVAATTAAASAVPRVADAATEARPLYYDRKILAADLEGRTLRELAILRNMPYARAGKKFRKPWLNDYFAKHSWYKPTDTFDESKVSKLDHENAQLVAEYEANLKHDELQRRADAIRPRVGAGGATPDDELELQLLSIRIGSPQHTVEVAAASSPLEDPASLDRLLTVKELDALSPRDLRILRNTVYARRGRPFNSPILDSYFKSMDWYKPDTGYSDNRLTAIDQKNIKVIRSVEDSLGGPVTDSDMAWFGGA